MNRFTRDLSLVGVSLIGLCSVDLSPVDLFLCDLALSSLYWSRMYRRERGSDGEDLKEVGLHVGQQDIFGRITKKV
ncbi:hypothetical protein F5Y10DRAFT_234777 [Nemania abortiva]|nr:hypothetical protein F5Y10DRAFT_234777 [Nemania abortiva]